MKTFTTTTRSTLGHYRANDDGSAAYAYGGDVITTRTDGLWRWPNGELLPSTGQRIYENGYRKWLANAPACFEPKETT